MSMIGRMLGFMSSVKTYATWNASDKGTNIALSNGNLTATMNGAGSVRSTISKSSGKWFWEYTVTTSVSTMVVGIGNGSADITLRLGNDVNGWGYIPSGNSRTNSVNSAYGSAYTSGDVIGLALDMDAGTLTCYLNGVSQGTMVSGLTGSIFAGVGDGATTTPVVVANFGASAFAHSAPAGYNSGLYN